MKLSNLKMGLRLFGRRVVHHVLTLCGEGLERGDARYEAGDWHRAYRSYRVYLFSHPFDGEIWLNAADCAVHLDDLTGEFYCLRQLLHHEPSDVAILVKAAHQYARHDYFLTARACLMRARRIDPNVPFEPFERRAASRQSVASGCRLLLDISDMLAFFRANVRKTGMQRVQAEVMTSLIERNVGGDIAFVFFDDAEGQYKVVPILPACELVDATNAGTIATRQLLAIIPQIFEQAEPLTCKQGDLCLVLGAFWFGGGYLSRLNDLRKDGAKVGINFFDLIPYMHPEYVDVATQREFTGKLEEALASIDFACTNSVFVANELRKLLTSLGRKDVPVGAVPLAHDISDTGGDQSVAETFKASLPQEYVLCVGTIEPRKNHALLLEVWKRLYDRYGEKAPSLLIIGKWGWRIESFRENLAAANNVHGKIVVLEGLSDSELQYLYRHCLFTVFPSFAEGWGLPVGESLYFGKPCLASNSSSIPEVGGDLVRYFDPKNVDEAYRVIDATLSDRQDLAAWTEDVRRRFKPRSWDQVTDDFMDKVFTLSSAVTPAQ